MTPDLAPLLLISSSLSMAGAGAGVLLAGVPDVARRVVPVGGAVLVFLSIFFILPELARVFGWQAGPALMMTGLLLVWFVDRFVYPVCPACSPAHDHHFCSTRLHGFAGPLVTAALLHSVFDGWTLAAGHEYQGIGTALAAGVIVHKIPESIAYGVILQAALKSRHQALAWALIAQAFTVAGAGVAVLLSPVIGTQWMGVLLAFGGGTFLYLGLHAIHGEWKRRLSERALRLS